MDFEQNWPFYLLAGLVVYWFFTHQREGFVPLSSAERHDGFNVYPDAAMKGGRIYSKLNNVSHDECRAACKARWGNVYKECQAYNYQPATGDCHLLEYSGEYGGGITPHTNPDYIGGYNYNNPYSFFQNEKTY